MPILTSTTAPPVYEEPPPILPPAEPVAAPQEAAPVEAAPAQSAPAPVSSGILSGPDKGAAPVQTTQPTQTTQPPQQAAPADTGSATDAIGATVAQVPRAILSGPDKAVAIKENAPAALTEFTGVGREAPGYQPAPEGAVGESEVGLRAQVAEREAGFRQAQATAPSGAGW